MKHNMGKTDRIVRLLVVLVIAALYFMGMLSGTGAIIALVIAAIFALTSAISFCPLYGIFGINTDKKD